MSTLIVYFSATGTTRRVAEKLSAAIDAPAEEIKAEPPFTAADLDWNDPSSRCSKEHADRSMRPAIQQPAPDASGYDTVLLGYPLWWETAPREVRTWLESQDWSGKTIATFATSSMSVRGADGTQLHDSAPAAHWVDGRRFTPSTPEIELRNWAESVEAAK
ncbi:MAG: flavodoxin [Bifidobacterium sp.]|nr:flavodoxin [Bifidobacterium sp.]